MVSVLPVFLPVRARSAGNRDVGVLSKQRHVRHKLLEHTRAGPDQGKTGPRVNGFTCAPPIPYNFVLYSAQ